MIQPDTQAMSQVGKFRRARHCADDIFRRDLTKSVAAGIFN